MNLNPAGINKNIGRNVAVCRSVTHNFLEKAGEKRLERGGGFRTRRFHELFVTIR